ncbi:MAG: FAD-binding oxidoreductase, partial [Gemmatimonadales bacterium]
MTDPVFGRLRELLGAEGVERSADGSPVATPDSPDAIAHLCQVSNEEGWRVRIEGRGTWLDADAPCDLAIRLRALDRVTAVSPEDLVTTIQAGAPLDAVGLHLAERGMRLALDPPGRPDRSLGSVVATATAGPARLGYGAVRDHILGCTVVTGDGRLVRSGGRVVKNVAGYDLTRLQVGGFGAFGILTEVHCRLRALPRADETLFVRGNRNVLLALARDTLEAGITPVALELFSPALAAGPDWVLAARFQGGGSAVHAEVQRLPQGEGAVWEAVAPERSSAFWALAARAALGAG